MNPLALITWMFLAGIGFLIGDINGAVWGFVVGTGASILLSMK